MSRIVMVASCAWALSVWWADAAWAQRSERPRLAEASHVVTLREVDAVSKIRAHSRDDQNGLYRHPVSDVVTYLKDYHHIEIQLDRKAREAASIGEETPVTRQLDGITLRSARESDAFRASI